ncbi:hypothetical protein [Lachnoclostridium phytofermentans]|uniref:Lipoprotein n=1 Tax=Lachnoclostridium phytofermentans (strain ATCC 700394 / DSM 18823 / ISDg) TaxID=357809 RepID=A9KRV8_LACP7|nr:hypothetical protein [Lachnoclostridium phytofermentans]ABX43602.1 hypothetical protein Cphy_3248 [Lachnoclostridium phytofermentans ISDg]
MKKKFLALLLLVNGCLFIVACSNNIVEKPSENSTESVLPTIQEQSMSKENVISIFTSEEKNRNCTVTDCVVTKDSAYGLNGIVQYTDKDGNPSCLAFVKDSVSCPIGLDADNSSYIADDSNLVYQGDGIVTLSLRNAVKDVVKDYTVEFKCDETGIDFTISSVERK